LRIFEMAVKSNKATQATTEAKFQVGDWVEIYFRRIPLGLSKEHRGQKGRVSFVRFTRDGSPRYNVKLQGGLIWVEERHLISAEPDAIGIASVEPSPLETLSSQITQYWAESDSAQEVAQQALYSALDSARLCGEALLEAKKQVGHGKWEEFRENLKHPRTGKPMPSSTATLYQRVAEHWQELQEAKVETLREAGQLLKKPRQVAAKPQAALQASQPTEDPQSVADLEESLDGDLAKLYGKNVKPETAQRLADAGVVPCRPGITPEEFNREMQEWHQETADFFDRSGETQSRDRIQPYAKREVLFGSNRGIINSVLIDWETMQVSAVIIDHGNRQTQVPASEVTILGYLGE
jgi:hypothetical protein